MGPWLSFPDQAKGEKVSDIAQECVRHVASPSVRTAKYNQSPAPRGRRLPPLAQGRSETPILGQLARPFGRASVGTCGYLPFICGTSLLFSLQTSSIRSVSTNNASGCVKVQGFV